MKHLLFETDWLASHPVFYNSKTGSAGRNINDVIDHADIEFHPEGFNNFLHFGYSAFEQTPIKHVKFLRHSSRLWRDEKGALEVEYLEDPVDKWLDYRLSEPEIIDLTKERVQHWENSVSGEIIIPTSGGYDSRLLNWCIADKARIRSFTYGVSTIQSDSFEVVRARHLSQIMGVRWQQIELGEFHQYFTSWDDLFGISTHAHGMYHFEFYKKILTSVSGGNPFLSGIIGDAWTGNVSLRPCRTPNDVFKLGFTHGLSANESRSLLSRDSSLLMHYWAKQKKRLKDPRIRIIESMRFKIILLCYLLKVPKHHGFKPWTPFLDIDLCMAMLNLPPERRLKRLWQKEFFEKVGLYVEDHNQQETHENTLNFQAIKRMPLLPLDSTILGQVVNHRYITSINSTLENQDFDWKRINRFNLLFKGKARAALRRLGYKDANRRRLEAYCAYLVLYPIQQLMQKTRRPDA